MLLLQGAFLRAHLQMADAGNRAGRQDGRQRRREDEARRGRTDRVDEQR